MYFSNGFVYGGDPTGEIKVVSVKTFEDKIMLITFNNGEQRLFDATILSGPAFLPLNDNQIFMTPEIDHGVVTWKDGLIDCAPEYMYQHSYEYAQEGHYA